MPFCLRERMDTMESKHVKLYSLWKQGGLSMSYCGRTRNPHKNVLYQTTKWGSRIKIKNFSKIVLQKKFQSVHLFAVIYIYVNYSHA